MIMLPEAETRVALRSLTPEWRPKLLVLTTTLLTVQHGKTPIVTQNEPTEQRKFEPNGLVVGPGCKSTLPVLGWCSLD